MVSSGLTLTLSATDSKEIRRLALASKRRLNLSRDELGRRLGVSGPRVSQVINGDKPLRLEAALILAQSLGLDLTKIVPELRCHFG